MYPDTPSGQDKSEAVEKAKRFPSQHRATISGPEAPPQWQWAWKRRGQRCEGMYVSLYVCTSCLNYSIMWNISWKYEWMDL